MILIHGNSNNVVSLCRSSPVYPHPPHLVHGKLDRVLVVAGHEDVGAIDFVENVGQNLHRLKLFKSRWGKVEIGWEDGNVPV